MRAGPPQAHFLMTNQLWKSTASAASDFFTSDYLAQAFPDAVGRRLQRAAVAR